MQLTAEASLAERPDRAAILLRQAERALLDGVLDEARELLTAAWALAADHSPVLAGRAAWEMALLYARLGTYGEAASWFSRVNVPPGSESPVWPVGRQALIDLCHTAAGKAC